MGETFFYRESHPYGMAEFVSQNLNVYKGGTGKNACADSMRLWISHYSSGIDTFTRKKRVAELVGTQTASVRFVLPQTS